MKVKIDTKEKMHVITLEDEKMTENMTEELVDFFLPFLDSSIPNIVINLKEVKVIETGPAKALTSVQQRFYDANHSLVFCKLQTSVSDFLDENGLLELMNVTPTESEACDIVQMEEIEREYL